MDKHEVSNMLYYGKNLDILRRYVADESVDLIYLDPPFNSNADYNVLFAEHDGTPAHAQFKAFEDTWTWDTEAAANFQDAVQNGGEEVAKAMTAFRTFLGTSDMLAYLSNMAPCLVELRRVLKPTGSIYLHCDPTASHYLKLLTDAVFGPGNFRSEIIWRRTGAHNKANRYAPIHDVILLASKTQQMKWNLPKRPYMRQHVEENFVQEGQRWRTDYYGNVLTGSGTRNGESGKPWRGINPTEKGRHWAIPGKLIEEVKEETGKDLSSLGTLAKLERLYELGYVKITEGQAWPEYSHYIDPARGQSVSDIWAFQPYTQGLVFGTDEGIDEDVRWLSTRDQERLGYPTQKPEGLLQRIIEASSNEGDVVLDPFCGCGTTIAVAQRLNRRWIGIDITHLAINLIKVRLRDAFGVKAEETYQVIGEPVSVPDAKQLAKDDPFQFQCWALGLVGARPVQVKRGADKGIDGRLFFHDGPEKDDTKQVVISVKGGKNVTVKDLRDLVGVVNREKAAIGVLITMTPPTKPMKTEAAAAGFYNSPACTSHPRLQILTIKDLLAGRKTNMPRWRDIRTFKKAPKARRARARSSSRSLFE